MLYIKDYIEKQNGSEISINEFKAYFTNPTFMRTILNQEWSFTDAELQKLLSEVYEENISLMIEFMNKRKEIPFEEETVKPDSFEEIDDENDIFEWEPIDFDEEESKNKSFL